MPERQLQLEYGIQLPALINENGNMYWQHEDWQYEDVHCRVIF